LLADLSSRHQDHLPKSNVVLIQVKGEDVVLADFIELSTRILIEYVHAMESESQARPVDISVRSRFLHSRRDSNPA
jgi:adenylate cyclase